MLPVWWYNSRWPCEDAKDTICREAEYCITYIYPIGSLVVNYLDCGNEYCTIKACNGLGNGMCNSTSKGLMNGIS